MSGKSEFVCDSCGRRFAWKPALAGKSAKCKCGAILNIPTEDPAGPAAESGGFELDLPDDLAPPPPTAAGTATNCINCNHPLKPGAVICMNCGTDQRTGSKIQTGVQELDTGTRRKANIESALPMWGMRTLQVGMWFNLWGVVLILMLPALGFVGGILSWITGVPAVGGIVFIVALICYVIGIVLTLVGPILCAFVPGQASARAVLLTGIGLFAGSIAVQVIGALAAFAALSQAGSGAAGLSTNVQAPLWTQIASPLMTIGAVLCYLYFLWMLAKSFEFPEVSERAERLLVHVVIFPFTLPLLFIPIMGCFILIGILIYALFIVSLYLALLTDLTKCIAHRIREMA